LVSPLRKKKRFALRSLRAENGCHRGWLDISLKSFHPELLTRHGPQQGTAAAFIFIIGYLAAAQQEQTN